MMSVSQQSRHGDRRMQGVCTLAARPSIPVGVLYCCATLLHPPNSITRDRRNNPWPSLQSTWLKKGKNKSEQLLPQAERDGNLFAITQSYPCVLLCYGLHFMYCGHHASSLRELDRFPFQACLNSLFISQKDPVKYSWMIFFFQLYSLKKCCCSSCKTVCEFCSNFQTHFV